MQSNGNQSQIVLFESSYGAVMLDVTVDSQKDEVWLNRAQMAMLFDRDVKTIGKHIANALKEELDASNIPTVAKFATVQIEGNRQVERDIEYYNLDVIMWGCRRFFVLQVAKPRLSQGISVKPIRGTDCCALGAGSGYALI